MYKSFYSTNNKFSSKNVLVIGYWATMEIPTQEYSSLFDNPISSAIKPLRQHLEDLVSVCGLKLQIKLLRYEKYNLLGSLTI